MVLWSNFTTLPSGMIAKVIGYFHELHKHLVLYYYLTDPTQIKYEEHVFNLTLAI